MYKGIDNITNPDQAAVNAAMERWAAHRANPAREDIKLLFDKFHEYVYRSPVDSTCPSCVQYIYDYWTKQINKWNETKL